MLGFVVWVSRFFLQLFFSCFFVCFHMVSLLYMSSVLLGTKEQYIGNYEYIGTWILRIYRKYR